MTKKSKTTPKPKWWTGRRKPVRKFGKKNYTVFHRFFFLKSLANHQARILRNQGSQVRVVQGKTKDGRKAHFLYVRG